MITDKLHIKAYMACFTKVDIMLLKLQYITKSSLMNSWKVCYPKCLGSSMNLHTAVIMCMDYPSLRQFPISSNWGMILA